MTHDSTVILGIPVDNLDLAETVSRIFEMIDAGDRDGRPRLAVTVKAGTLINMRSRSLRQTDSGHPASVIGQADLFIPVGAQVSLAARILNLPLKQTFSGPVLFRNVFEKAGSDKKFIYLLGGEKSMIRMAAESVRAAFPGLTVAGADTLKEETICDQDMATISPAAEKINISGADILLVDLNDPAVFAWFEKNRFRLYAPLTLVISGTFDLIRAARKQFQKKESGRGRRRLVKTLRNPEVLRNLRITLMLLPLVLYQKYRQVIFKLFHRRSITAVRNAVSKPGNGMAVNTITMPDPLDATLTGEIRDEIRQMAGKAPKIVLDFTRVNFIDSSGLGLLLGLWRTARTENREIFIIGLKPAAYRFFKLSRTLDFFRTRICGNIEDVLALIRTRSAYSNFYHLALIRRHSVIYHLSGELNASEIIDLDVRAFMEPLGGRDVIFNLTGLTFLDSAGIRLLVRIHRHVSRNGRSCILCGLRENVGQMIRIVRLDELFFIADNIFAAELTLRRIHLQRATGGGNERSVVSGM